MELWPAEFYGDYTVGSPPTSIGFREEPRSDALPAAIAAT